MRRRRLRIEITVALIIKLVALVAIWYVWFSDSRTPRVEDEQVANHIGAAPAKSPQHEPRPNARR